ncbi:alkaline phosphatase family protein [Allobranchiibius sp. CTAmp26]|uniref:alkaline phosphatase family protein n=1 Tax=Allobranchiibius sp. CTAmp26 TaxID=2815214 RepID=UPI001AA12055|nr:alkaline phosphatase family protein [Allobranchiibius sp. CTAmp26]MBO1755279.1 alkaline phosphatase family protein [Allobranchiibius sp. CTAmp26]
MTFSRRQFLGAAAAVGGTAFATDALGSHLPAAAATSATLPAPNASGIDHIVVVMMENRSFDHFMGWLPGADGKQAGLTYTDRYGVPRSTYHLKQFASCGHADPDHSYEGGRIQFDDGRVDGWLRAGEDDLLPIGYYQQPDLAFLGQAGPRWTVCDRYFSAVMAETYPNRFYMHAAQTDRLHNSTVTATMPTIWDRLAAAKLTGRYYFSDIPFLALWGTKYLSISRPFSTFLTDAAAGTLPQVSFIDPRFEDEASGTSSDDHPHADIRAGEQFLNQVYRAVTTSPNWARTLLVVNFDEWGGFYDHVAPATAPDVSPQTALRGFRVPALVVSPQARRKFVAHGTYDHTSVLKAIEWRWGLPALTPRDSAARNIAEVLDFGTPPNLSAPAFAQPPFVAAACAPAALSGPEQAEWPDLRTKALADGWSLP